MENLKSYKKIVFKRTHKRSMPFWQHNKWYTIDKEDCCYWLSAYSKDTPVNSNGGNFESLKQSQQAIR